MQTKMKYIFLGAHVDAVDVKTRARGAAWLKIWIDHRRLEDARVCVVFDIDETLIDANEDEIQSIARVYHHCVRVGVPVFLVTARPESDGNREYTESMLQSRGFGVYERLYMMPEHLETAELISRFKTASREHIARTHTICACVGDQPTDHFLLPDDASMMRRLEESIDDDSCAVFVRKGVGYLKLRE